MVTNETEVTETHSIPFIIAIFCNTYICIKTKMTNRNIEECKTFVELIHVTYRNKLSINLCKIISSDRGIFSTIPEIQCLLGYTIKLNSHKTTCNKRINKFCTGNTGRMHQFKNILRG